MKLPHVALPLTLALGLSSAKAESHTINLETALRLAGARNLSIELARERVQEARSLLEQERAQLLPWLAPGLGYRRHDGNLQDIVGQVFDTSKQSGTAALTLQAQLNLGDSIYRMLAARQVVAANEARDDAQRRSIHLAAATGYTELCRASAAVVTTEESLQITDRTLAQVREAVAAGLAFAGDAVRVEVQRERNEATVLAARQDARVASARLAQLLRLPPSDELLPNLTEFVPTRLVSTNLALDALVASALTSRPELRHADALVNAAKTRRSGVTRGPWLPTVGAQAALGGLAGGRNGEFGNADDFQEVGVGVSWRIGPGGIGDRSLVRTANARIREAELEREQLRDDIVREVVELRTKTETAAGQVEIANRAAATAKRLLNLTLARREFGVGAVLEAIEAEREFARTRADQLQSVAEHNRAQWTLWYVTGQDITKAGSSSR